MACCATWFEVVDDCRHAVSWMQRKTQTFRMRTQRLWTIRTESPVYKFTKSTTNSTEITATENWWAKHSIQTFATNQPLTAFFNRPEVRLDASNLKAWFRGAQASELLGLAEQGLYFCRGALQLDPKESPVFVNKNQHQLSWNSEDDLEEILLEVQYNLLILNLFGVLSLFWRRLSCKGEVWNQDLVRDDLRSNFTIDLALGLHTKQFHRLSY